MPNTTLSPNMNLPVPTVSEDPGPDWATNIDACLSAIDSHNHSSGQDVPVTPSGLNINADLAVGSNNVTLARTVRFDPQAAALSAAADVGCIYEAGVDLYYNDANGNHIRITQGGAVAGSTGTITGLPSGTASASFSGATFTFQSATSTPATMAVGPLVIGRNAASSKTVTISPNGSQAANYAVTLPVALPSVTSYIYMDNTGQMALNTDGYTGTGALVLASGPTIASPTLTSPSISSPAISSPTVSGTVSGVIAAGAYTPTASSGGAGSGQTAAANSFSYTRINDRVTVYGLISGTTDSSGNLYTYLTLPVNPTSNFSTVTDLVGVSALSAAGVGFVQAKVSDKKASVRLFYSGVGVPVSESASISFTYSCV